MLQKRPLLSLCISAALLTGCAGAGNSLKNITLFSDEKLNTMGAQSFEELKATETIETDPAINRYVQCVAKNITDQVPSDVHSGSWEVVVFESEQVNAFALPGGKIGVYTGILEVAGTQDQLAAILGHEVAHVTKRHSNQRMSSSAVSQVALGLGDQALSNLAPETKALLMSGMGLGVQYGVLMPFGRAHEAEADIEGHKYMASAGFLPQGAVDLWINMASQSEGQQPEFMSTHPSHETRINGLRSHKEVVEPLYQASTSRPTCYTHIK